MKRVKDLDYYTRLAKDIKVEEKYHGFFIVYVNGVKQPAHLHSFNNDHRIEMVNKIEALGCKK